jgi:O-antigen/teichoic acid export membrane protein
MISAQTGLAKNSLWMILSRFGAQGLAVIFTIFLARRLGSAGFGEYAFIAALIYVANSLTTFGTDMVLIREIAAQDDLSSLPAALLLQLILSVVLIAALWAWGAQIPNQNAETILALKLYILSLIPLAFFTVFTTALRGEQRMDAYAALNLTIAALQAGAVLLPGISLVRLSIFLLGLQIVVAILAGAICVRVIPNFGRAWRPLALNLLATFYEKTQHVTLRERSLRPKGLRRYAARFFATLRMTLSEVDSNLGYLLKACAPIALLTVLGMVYQRLSITMLSTMTSATDTGFFSAAARTVEASKTIHLAIFAALYPAMALARSDGLHQKKLMQSIRASRNVLLAGGIIGALILFVFANPIIALLYGGEFHASAPVLQILAWALIPFTINNYLTLSFVASKQEWLVGRALAASLLGLLILNLWWIPVWGPVGSAWATLLAECLQSMILLVSLQQSKSAFKGGVHELPNLP